MIMRRVVVLVLVLSSALALFAQTQDSDEDARIIEEDSRPTTVADREQAVANLLAKAEELRNSGQMIEAARALNRVGRFQIRMSAPDQAVKTFQDSLKTLRQQPDVKTQVDSLNGLASGYDWLSKCDQVDAPVREAIALSKQTGYVAGEAEGLLTLSDCQNHDDHALAVQTAQQSLELYKSINRKRGMAEAYMALAHYQMAQDDLLEASKYTNTALEIYTQLNDVPEQTVALVYLGYIELRKGFWQDAMTYYIRTQSMIDEKAEPYRMGQISAGIGEAFMESGSPEIAIVKYREAIEYFRLTKNQRVMTVMGWSIGQAQFLLGHYQEALESLKTARAETKAAKDVVIGAYCDDFLGRTYFALNDYPSAIHHYQAALDGYSASKTRMEAARMQALIGRAYQLQGKQQEARDIYQTALGTFRQLGDRVNESATLYALGNLELENNDLDKAEEYLQNSIDITEQMRRVSTSSDLMTAFSARVHERYQSYIECLMRKHKLEPDQGYALKAFQASELARARVLTDLLQATQTNLAPGIDPALAEREKSLRQLLRVKENEKIALLGKEYSREQLAGVEGELAQLETQYKQVNDEIRSRYPAFDQISRPSAWDLQQIQKEIVADDDTVLLEFSLGKDKSYAWAVTRDRIESFELPSQAAINETAQKVYGAISTGDKQNDLEFTRAARQLSEMVVKPLAGHLNKSRLIVVADAALNYIPFQVLPAPSSNEPLVGTHEVINVPSASILGQLRAETSRRQDPSTLLAAFGDPVFASNYAQYKTGGEQVAALQTPQPERWQHALRDIQTDGDSVDPLSIQPLFYSKVELANLRELAGPQSFVATGFDASREKLEQTDLTKYAILHFATHGILDPKRPENSGLFLSMVDANGNAQKGFIGLQDIYKLQAPVDLVVLSACRTGLGKDVRGEGLIGLTRGFMYAGASSVMASLWKVDDEATAELMKRFYANMLQKQMTPSAALRAAQNSIRQEPQWRSPHFWAAFTLQGEYNKAIEPPTQSWRAALIVGLVSLALIIFGMWSYWRLRHTAVRR